MQSPGETEPCWPSQSLWSLIAQQVPGSELPKIRRALGTSLVDMYIDLYAEAERWHQLWGRPGPQPGPGRGAPLADPPAIKELLRGQVEMLLRTLSETSSAGGSSAGQMASRYKPDVVDYVLGNSDRMEPKDTVTQTRLWSQSWGQSAAADQIEAVRDKLNITDIDQAVDRLKAVLVEECRALKRLLKHLKDDIKQRCKSPSGKKEPTLQDLKDLRGAIQMDLRLFSCSQAASPPSSAAAILQSPQYTFRLPSLQTSAVETLLTLNTVMKPHPPPPGSQKPGPSPIAARSRAAASVKQRNISATAHRCTSTTTNKHKQLCSTGADYD